MAFIDELVTGYPSLRTFVDRATAVRVQNVADYYYTGSSQEHWWPKDFPNCAPPWSAYFVSWKLPRFSNNEGKLTEFPALTRHDTISAVVAMELPERQWLHVRWVLPVVTYVRPAALVGLNLIRLFQVMLVAPDGTMINGEELDDNSAAAVTALYDKYRFPLTFRGNDKIDTHVRFVHDGVDIPPEQVSRGTVEAVQPGVTNPLKIVALTNSFVHCVNQVKVTREPVPQALLKKHARQGNKAPITSWHTLEIEPIRRILTEIQRTRSVSLQQALHLARGHFKKYGPKFGKGLLMGKYEGTWFWHPQMRGTKASGERHKDYEVKV